MICTEVFSEGPDGWESKTRMAQIRSEHILVRGETWSDFLKMKPTPPHPRTSSECSSSLLSDTP